MKACLTKHCTVQYMVVKHSLRFKMMAVGLKLAGHKKVADMITSSWKVCHPSLSAPFACACARFHLGHPGADSEAPIREFGLSLRLMN